jgi:hypothetical protein
MQFAGDLPNKNQKITLESFVSTFFNNKNA